VWNSKTGAELLPLRAGSSIYDVSFSPDGKTIDAGTAEGWIIFWESKEPTGGYEPRRNAEIARRLVEDLYRKFGSYHDVIRQVQGDATLDSPVRKAAIQIADTYKWKDADTLRADAWATVRLPDKDVAAYQVAMEKVNKANALEPNDPAILDVLAAAQYRLGSYEDARKTLAKSAQILSDAGEEPDPGNVAFTAMTLHKIGRADEAKAALDQLRELCKDEQFAEDMEVQELLAEAEGLIEGKKP
jgi:tetratricopeptide (TPR) repeat protein